MVTLKMYYTRKLVQIDRISVKSNDPSWLVRFIERINPGFHYRMRFDLNRDGTARK